MLLDRPICRRYQLLSFVDGVGMFCSESMAQCDVCSTLVDDFVAKQIQAEAGGGQPAATTLAPPASPVLSGTSQQAESGMMWNDGLNRLHDCFYPDSDVPPADSVSHLVPSPASPPLIFRKSQDENKENICVDNETWDNSFPTQYSTLSALSCSPLEEAMRNAGMKRGGGDNGIPSHHGFKSFEYVNGKLTCSPLSGRNKKPRTIVAPVSVEPFTTEDTLTIHRVTRGGSTTQHGGVPNRESIDASPFLPRSLIFGAAEGVLMNPMTTVPSHKMPANPYINKSRVANPPDAPPHDQGDYTSKEQVCLSYPMHPSQSSCPIPSLSQGSRQYYHSGTNCNVQIGSQVTASSVYESTRLARQKVYSCVNEFCMKGILTPGTVHPCCGVCHVLLPGDVIDFSSSLRHDSRNCKFQTDNVCTNCGNQMRQGSCGFNGKSFHCVSIPRRFTKGCCTTCCIPYNNRLPSPLHDNDQAMHHNCRKIDNTYFWKVVMTLFRERRSVLAMIVSNHIKDEFQVMTATQSSFGNWLVSDMFKKSTDINRTLHIWYFWHKLYRHRKF